MASEHGKKGILLLNLGSPDSTETQDVRRYLREFLSDERVLDVAAPVRQAVLNLFILPFRPKESAEAYHSIWTEEGSPLVATTHKVAALLAGRLGQEVPVEVGMRYGSPSTRDALIRLKSRGVGDLLVVPLYPHYAMSSYETAVAKAFEEAKSVAPTMRLTIQNPFFEDPEYIEALWTVAKPYLDQKDTYDHILFSYHGIPERHVQKTDPSGCFCLKYDDCCARKHPAHSFCYRHQVHATTWAFARRAGLAEGDYTLSFQSRLGRDPWLKPYTDKELEKFPSKGVKRLLVMCPAFVSDCLETLEEIAIRGRQQFKDAGGVELTYVPCLNDHPRWIDVLEKFARTHLKAPALGQEAAAQ